ncbi:hypothetical protein [Brevundimonas sp.]|uniref:ImuA family protein n=1 Tax=Brevundimonas sp. TaxID=1871086 RepID=UPI0022C48997|nr:hypothetical protein [Brevundimonas sp.]MCZ8195084.1 hypothetical protein [Brevundimonas sp.]
MPAPSLAPVPDDQSSLAALEPRSRPVDGGFGPAWPGLDPRLGQLRRDALHEVRAAEPRHAVAAAGFGLGLACLARGGDPDPLVWVLETRAEAEIGALYGPGLQAWGLDPAAVLLVRAARPEALLAAGEEALRSGSAGAVLMTAWGDGRAFSLTASRRLALAAEAGGRAGLLVRAGLPAGAPDGTSAAETRWHLRPAPSTAPPPPGPPPLGLAARAPGRPAFRAALFRSRAGIAPAEWIMEWDRAARAFVAPTPSGGLVSLPADRPAGAARNRPGRRAA